MNQGIAFARTLRALDADDFGASKLGLLLAVLLLIGWSWWMLAARFPQYETTTNVRIEQGRAVAYFPADVINRIKVGEPAIIHIDGVAFSSHVESIAPDNIDLALPATSHQPAATISADVETTRVSPAAIALQTLTRGNR